MFLIGGNCYGGWEGVIVIREKIRAVVLFCTIGSLTMWNTATGNLSLTSKWIADLFFSRIFFNYFLVDFSLERVLDSCGCSLFQKMPSISVFKNNSDRPIFEVTNYYKCLLLDKISRSFCLRATDNANFNLLLAGCCWISSFKVFQGQARRWIRTDCWCRRPRFV